MIKSDDVRAAMLMFSLESVPPILVEELLSDGKLPRGFGVKWDPVLTFPGASVSFRRSKLFTAVRQAVKASKKPSRLQDRDGVIWDLVLTRTDGVPGLLLKSAARELDVARLLFIAPHKGFRKALFLHQSEVVNLDLTSRKCWMRVLERRALSSQELDELWKEISSTVVGVTAQVRETLACGSLSVDVCVPRSLQYYEAFVGRCEGHRDIREYFSQVVVGQVRRLLAWNRCEGLQQSLLLGSHSLLAELLSKEVLSAPEFERLAKWAVNADVLTQCATLELAFRRSRPSARVRSAVRDLAQRFALNATPENRRAFELLSATFVMVYGELARARTLVSKPPFWRRLAAFAQAALIVRSLESMSVEGEKLIETLLRMRLPSYTAQCFVDMREEPRWLAEFGMSLQLRNELGGRVLGAAYNNAAAVDKLGVRDVLLGSQQDSLSQQVILGMVDLPGPLEGNFEASLEPPTTALASIREKLSDSNPSASSFGPLLNRSLVWKFPKDIPKLAEEALRRAQFYIDAGGNSDSTQSCLMGLATFAAATRSHELADGLFMVLRNYRQFFAAELSVGAAFRIGMAACASRLDLPAWCQCVGSLVADLGFAELSRDEAKGLSQQVAALCDVVPDLWASCGRGIAALEAAGCSN